MSSIRPIRVTAVRGHVIQGLYGQGSRSEREATFIETADARYILRRKNGPVFNDIELIQYVGHEVECDGFLVGTTLLAEHIKLLR
jgi:hypothetical protein